MVYTLYYGNFEYTVEQSYGDILAYEFNKAFNLEYTPYTVLCTKEQKDFIEDFDRRWWHNDIHEYDYYTTRNYEFLDWLKARYADAVEEAQYIDEDDLVDPDSWWDSLDDEVKDDIMKSHLGY